MGLPAGEATAEDLRGRYRALMMRHHPDVDPSGLEVCKDVNAAYALLISDITGAG
jgi:DnaJ-class molecular chaperone